MYSYQGDKRKCPFKFGVAVGPENLKMQTYKNFILRHAIIFLDFNCNSKIVVRSPNLEEQLKYD